MASFDASIGPRTPSTPTRDRSLARPCSAGDAFATESDDVVSHRRSASFALAYTPQWMSEAGWSRQEYFESVARSKDRILSDDSSVNSGTTSSTTLSEASSQTSVSEPGTEASAATNPFLPSAASPPSREVRVSNLGNGRFQVEVMLPGFDMMTLHFKKDGRLNIMADRWDKPASRSAKEIDGEMTAPKGEHFERIIDFGHPKKRRKAESVFKDGLLTITVEAEQ